MCWSPTAIRLSGWPRSRDRHAPRTDPARPPGLCRKRATAGRPVVAALRAIRLRSRGPRRASARAGAQHHAPLRSGTGEAFLHQALAAVVARYHDSLQLIADGTRWIQAFFRDHPARILRNAIMLLDWYHLEQKCRDMTSRICRNRPDKASLLRRPFRRLWAGKVCAAAELLAAYRSRPRTLPLTRVWRGRTGTSGLSGRIDVPPTGRRRCGPADEDRVVSTSRQGVQALPRFPDQSRTAICDPQSGTVANGVRSKDLGNHDWCFRRSRHVPPCSLSRVVGAPGKPTFSYLDASGERFAPSIKLQHLWPHLLPATIVP